jgi:4-carboxymuconolactone decarboxylase
MPRVPEFTSKDNLAPEFHHIFDTIAGTRSRVHGPFAVLLNSPEIAGRIAEVGSYVRFNSTLEPDVRELAIITIAREQECDFEWFYHEAIAREAGVRNEAITAVAEGTTTIGLTDIEALVVNYGRELAQSHRVSEKTFTAALEQFGPQGVTDLTATFGYYGMIAFCLNAFDVKPPEGKPILPA